MGRLAAADVTVVGRTLPAAAFALAVGVLAWKDGRGRSWLNLGPAVALALAPTLVLAIARNDDGRAIAVGIAALVVLVAGARQQLQAPIVLGAVSLVALGVAKIGPGAHSRWTMLAIAGALLLWVGDLRTARDDVQRGAASRPQLTARTRLRRTALNGVPSVCYAAGRAG
jgi:hypothetical protein